MLAEESPASFVAWDLLALGDEDLRATPQGERRARLESVLGKARAARSTSRPRPATGRPPPTGSTGSRGPASTASSPSGSMAPTSRASGRCSRSSTSARRTASSPGSAGTRTARARTSARLLLGLFDDEGTLHHVGVTSSFTWDRREALAEELAPLARGRARRTIPGRNGPSGRATATPTPPASGCPGATSRWNRGKDLSWEPLRAERVAEVAYDHLQGDRFRHGTTFKRWRPDKSPADCRYDQLEDDGPVPAEPDLRDVTVGRQPRAARARASGARRPPSSAAERPRRPHDRRLDLADARAAARGATAVPIDVASIPVDVRPDVEYAACPIALLVEVADDVAPGRSRTPHRVALGGPSAGGRIRSAA